MPIRSFANKTAEAVFNGRCPKGFPPDLFKAARRKLAVLDAAISLDVRRSPPGNKLHALEKDPAGKVAKACGIARTRIERIAAEQIGISGDTALRLGRVLGTGPEFWMYLQSRFEIETARAALGDGINALHELNRAA